MVRGSVLNDCNSRISGNCSRKCHHSRRNYRGLSCAPRNECNQLVRDGCLLYPIEQDLYVSTCDEVDTAIHHLFEYSHLAWCPASLCYGKVFLDQHQPRYTFVDGVCVCHDNKKVVENLLCHLCLSVKWVSRSPWTRLHFSRWAPLISVRSAAQPSIP